VCVLKVPVGSDGQLSVASFALLVDVPKENRG